MNLLISLFFSFIEVGMFSVGGGYAAIPLIQDQIVNVHKLMTMAEFTDLITIAEMTPGPVSINSSTFVGTRLAGPLGAVLCTLGCIIPSFIICLTLAHFYYKYRSFSGVQTVLGPAPGGGCHDRLRWNVHSDAGTRSTPAFIISPWQPCAPLSSYCLPGPCFC